MKKTTTLFSISAILFVIALTIQSCKKDEDKTNPAPSNEFIADDNTFTSFMSWTLVATNNGPDPLLGTAHAGNDSTVTRRVYVKNNQGMVDGKYPVGTIVVKHSSNPSGTVNEYTGMVKRGNGFNPSNNDWEWFMLKPDGTIADDGNGGKMRGASLMGGMCGMCHSQASAKDFVFSK